MQPVTDARKIFFAEHVDDVDELQRTWRRDEVADRVDLGRRELEQCGNRCREFVPDTLQLSDGQDLDHTNAELYRLA